MRYLLDTCVVSELANHRSNPRVIDWLSGQNPDDLFLSTITIGEIQKGIAKRGDDARSKELDQWLQKEIIGSFSDRILPVDRNVALSWGRICGESERIGRKRPAVDSLIVATALTHDMAIVTRNVGDMAGLGVPIFNPFGGGS